MKIFMDMVVVCVTFVVLEGFALCEELFSKKKSK